MNKAVKIGLVVLLTIFLVLIRFFEPDLFYDPLYFYFKSDYSNLPIPEMDIIKFTGNITLRFLMNTIVSLAILWVLFISRSIVKLSSILYVMLFMILMMVFYFQKPELKNTFFEYCNDQFINKSII